MSSVAQDAQGAGNFQAALNREGTSGRFIEQHHVGAELLGQMQLLANKIARQEGIDQSGFRTVFNCGPDSGQEVYHIHLHLLGGRPMRWPPG